MKRDRILGCMYGGAVGDALGYPVEFWNENLIASAFPNGRIEHFTSPALISDDTQMSLFTAYALLHSDGNIERARYAVAQAYLDWYKTQTGTYNGNATGLLAEKRLWQRRAPGDTCLSSLRRMQMHDDVMDSIEEPINDSKGCGGIMRVAPIALWYKGNDMQALDTEAAQLSAITHGHPLGYLSGAALVHILHDIVYCDMPLIDAAEDAKQGMIASFGETVFVRKINAVIDNCLCYAQNGKTDIQNIHQLGEGWVRKKRSASLYTARFATRMIFPKA